MIWEIAGKVVKEENLNIQIHIQVNCFHKFRQILTQKIVLTKQDSEINYAKFVEIKNYLRQLRIINY